MIFGTDGIRGIIDVDIDSQLAYNVGKGLAIFLNKRNLNKKVVIGCDTRNSSYTYVSAVCCGLSDYGIDIDIVGVVSTPMVSFFVSKNEYSAGIMITASHNDRNYNGIKIFNQFGEKLDSESELEIEKYINLSKKKSKNKGKINTNNRLQEKYIEYLCNYFNLNLKDMNIAVDCANGSNGKYAPKIYKMFGANIIASAISDDGKYINYKCGANHIENLTNIINRFNIDIGFSFDGDGDRLRVVLKNGYILSGDEILLVVALALKKKYMLNNLTIAGTIMTSLGIEKTLQMYNIKLIRSEVGDKKVIELMKAKSLSLGGESSGHICLISHIPNCDALFNSLLFIKSMQELGDEFNDILKTVIRLPNLTKNLNVDKLTRNNFDKNIILQKKINQIQEENKDIKIVVRPSGTEPVIRLYVESVSENLNKNIIEKLEFLLKK